MDAMIGMLKEALRPMTDPSERGCGTRENSRRSLANTASSLGGRSPAWEVLTAAPEKLEA